MNNDKWKKLIENFEKNVNSSKFEELDKNALIKLIFLFETISNKNITKEIIKYFDNEQDTFKKEIISFKIVSILNDVITKKYIKKESYSDYSLYYYTNQINLYINKNISIEKINDIINKFNFKTIYIIKTIKMKKNREMIEIVDKKIKNFKLLEEELSKLNVKEYYFIINL